MSQQPNIDNPHLSGYRNCYQYHRKSPKHPGKQRRLNHYNLHLERKLHLYQYQYRQILCNLGRCKPVQAPIRCNHLSLEYLTSPPLVVPATLPIKYEQYRQFPPDPTNDIRLSEFAQNEHFEGSGTLYYIFSI